MTDWPDVPVAEVRVDWPGFDPAEERVIDPELCREVELPDDLVEELAAVRLDVPEPRGIWVTDVLVVDF